MKCCVLYLCAVYIFVLCIMFTKVLGDNQSGYLVGSRLSLADVGLMECLLMTADYFNEPFQDFPHVKVSCSH